MFSILKPIKKLIQKKIRTKSAARIDLLVFKKKEAMTYIAVEANHVSATIVNILFGKVRKISPLIAKTQIPIMINFSIIFSTCNLLYDAL